jgi:2'-hydroxyisoflavone reductase
MDILILGGTVFLGRAMVEAAQSRGHRVVLFNRGRSNPGLFPQVEQVRGDRKVSLQALEGRTWDAVIDTSGYLPGDVERSARFFADRTGQYTFISSISVYAGFAAPGLDEDSPLSYRENISMDQVTGENYGALKVLCEQAAEAALPERNLIIRPGLICGPHDPTDRFTYWPYRVWQGGEVLAPGRPEQPVQFIDVRDLAEWNIALLEAGRLGVFNATGPEQPLPMGTLLAACQDAGRAAAGGSAAHLTWVSEEFLLQNQVAPWSDLPVWLPESDPELAGMSSVSISRARQAGLVFRPLAETVADTLAWAQTRPPEHVWRAGLKADRERQLLEAWKGQAAP